MAKTKKSTKVVAATKSIQALNKRIQELKAKIKGQELAVLKTHGIIDQNNDKIDQQTAVLDSLTEQIAAHNREIREIIETTAKRMIELDEYNEKVRVAKIAAMNVYGTLTVIQRDLKTIIETPGPDVTTPDTMEALLNGELHIENPPPVGEVPTMVEMLLFDDLEGTNFADDSTKAKNLSEGEQTDLGLIPETTGEEKATALFPDNAQFTEMMSSIPDDVTISGLFGEDEVTIPEIRENNKDLTVPTASHVRRLKQVEDKCASIELNP